jgi:hypothetical protein
MGFVSITLRTERAGCEGAAAPPPGSLFYRFGALSFSFGLEARAG